MAKYISNDFEIVNEDILFKIFDSIDEAWQWFKRFISGLKDLAFKAISGIKLDELGQAILGFLRNLPIIGNFIPNSQDQVDKTKEILGDISIGNGVTKLMNLSQYLITTLWNILPLTTEMKKWILSIFDYNDKSTYFQSLYKIMLDANIPVKYANAFLIIMAMRMPVYTMLYNFKPLWDWKKYNPTEEDKLHPFTAGNPNTDSETGLNEAEQKIQRKVQKFIQIKKLAELEERDNNLDLNKKFSNMIVKEAIISFIPICTLHLFQFFKYGLGISRETNPILGIVTEPIDWLLIILITFYYIYFVVTSLLLTSLAIENEETFHPSQQNNIDSNDEMIDSVLNY